MSFDVGSVIAKVDADITGFKKGMDEAKTHASGFGTHLKSVGDGIATLGKQAAVFSTVATGAIIAFGKASVDSFNESEKGIAQLQAVIKSTGGVAGVTAEEAIKLASAFQKTTTYSDEAVLSAENLLLTFTSITKDIFPQATETVLNMSTALGQDTKSSAIQLGKALQDPILGVTALRRVGVNFNTAQIEVIKNLVETGQKAKAQQLIMKELATEFGGSAAAQATTFAGKMEILKNRFDDFKETVGQVITSLADFAVTGNDMRIFDALANMLGSEDTANQIVDFLVQIRGAFLQLGEWISANKELVLTFVKALGVALGALMIIGTIAGAIALLTNPLVLVAAAIVALSMAWQTNFMGIRDITNTVVTAISGFFTNYLMPVIQQFTTWFAERWIYISTILSGAWQIIVGIIQVAWGVVSGVIMVGLQLLTGNWAGAWETIKSKASEVWGGLVKIFNGAVDFIKGWGGAILHELTKPFEDAWSRITQLVENIKSKLDFTKRNSPSVMDILNKSVDLVNGALDNLSFGGTINAHAAGLAVSNGGNQNSTTVVRIDMAGAIIADAYGAGQMGELVGDAIIKRLQQNLRV